MYKIWCEWDMGFSEVYTSYGKAMQAIHDADWTLAGFETAEEVINEGLVYIEEITVD